MRNITRIVGVVLVASMPLRAADPQTPVHWSASQLAATEAKIKSSVDPARHLGLERLLDSYGNRPTGVSWYLAAHLLGRARRPFTRLEPDWPELVEERVTAAEEALEL